MRASDKDGEIFVSPRKNVEPYRSIVLRFRKTVWPGDKYSFKMSVLFDFGREVTRWEDTFFFDWGTENIDEIVFLGTTPLFVSALGEWKKTPKGTVLVPLKGWKRIKSPARKRKTLRFEWGKPPTFLIRETFRFCSDVSPKSVKARFLVPRVTKEQRSQWYGPNKEKAVSTTDSNKNVLVTVSMVRKDCNTWEYVARYYVILGRSICRT